VLVGVCVLVAVIEGVGVGVPVLEGVGVFVGVCDGVGDIGGNDSSVIVNWASKAAWNVPLTNQIFRT
jgi:hypothetical protein